MSRLLVNTKAFLPEYDNVVPWREICRRLLTYSECPIDMDHYYSPLYLVQV
jgi:hypothetical protein